MALRLKKSPLKIHTLLALPAALAMLAQPALLEQGGVWHWGPLALTLYSSGLRAEGHYSAAAVAHMQEGVKLLRARQMARARNEFLAVVKMEPGVPDAYNNIGLSYAYENNPEKAISYYKKALEKDPTYAASLNNLGLLLYSGGKPEEALYYWNLCLKTSTEGQPELH